MEELIEEASGFYTDVFTLEWKKMILPVIMVLALSASAYSTLDLRNSPQSEERMELSVEGMTNISVVSLKTEYFNDSTNKTGRELSEEISQEIEKKEQDYITQEFTVKGALSQIQKLSFFPYTPKLYAPVPAGREDTVGTLAVIHYRQNQFEELDERLNSSENMTLEEFNSEVENIRDSSWEDEKVQSFLENYTLNEKTGASSLATSENIREKMRTGEVQELSLTSYLPAIFATLVLYYVINALAVETGRKAYGQVKKAEKDSQEQTEDKNSGEEKEEEGKE